MKKLLVTGISGFLGWHIAQHQQKEWEIKGTYHYNKPNLPNIEADQLNLTDLDAVTKYVKEYQPDAILHLAASSKPDICEQNHYTTAINIKATKHLALGCAHLDIPLVFTSTDLVFKGHDVPYVETDLASPILAYGRQKLEAERAVLKAAKGVVARLPLLYGLPENGLGFTSSWYRKLKRGNSIWCFTDEYRTPVSGADAAHGLFLLLEKEVNGIYHLGGKEKVSRYEFAKTMAKCLGFEDSKIKPTTLENVPMPAKRPKEVALNSNKAFTLGYSPKTLEENFEVFKQVSQLN